MLGVVWVGVGWGCVCLWWCLVWWGGCGGCCGGGGCWCFVCFGGFCWCCVFLLFVWGFFLVFLRLGLFLFLCVGGCCGGCLFFCGGGGAGDFWGGCVCFDWVGVGVVGVVVFCGLWFLVLSVLTAGRD
ncbi:hypothetical protein RA267_27735 [Pseudomonas syringae pv. tagetis]|uniref:hypothetical protein n=1 Tax=Pseudomonas syringae group genomosp. 7 TaxID=251699 RepID=UPI0037704542